MAQPSGRVCDTPSHHRIYIRSSLIICALDLVSILIRLVFVSWKLEVSLKTSLQQLLRRRFDDSDAKESANGTWLRWLLFVLGPLPQAIRLASFKGTPWTKVIRFIFLANFLVGEILIALGSRETSTDYIPLAAPTERKISQSMEKVDWCLKGVGTTSLIPAYFVCESILEVFGVDVARATNPGRYYHIFFFYYVIILAGYSDFADLVLDITKLAARKHHNVVRNLMLVVPQSDEDVFEIDEAAANLFGMFLLNFLYYFLAYKFLYDPSGTVNPGWTGVFG